QGNARNPLPSKEKRHLTENAEKRKNASECVGSTSRRGNPSQWQRIRPPRFLGSQRSPAEWRILVPRAGSVRQSAQPRQYLRSQRQWLRKPSSCRESSVSLQPGGGP